MYTKLYDIPKTIKIKNKIYKLSGCVSHQGDITSDYKSIGHFVAYCYTAFNHFEMYDDLKKNLSHVKGTGKSAAAS